MIFWFLILMMLVCAVLCVLIPLARSEGQDKGVNARDLYQEQLKLLDASESSDAEERAEIGRRLLRESNRETSESQSEGHSSRSVTIASLLALIFVPATSLALYYNYGAPSSVAREDVADKLSEPGDFSVSKMVQLAEQHLKKNPDDAKGWGVLADVYARTKQHSKRARALAQIIRIEGATATLEIDRAEALIFESNNRISDEAKALLTSALEKEPNSLRGNALYAVALEQSGETDAALKIWQQLARQRKDDAEFQNMVALRVAQIEKRQSDSAASEISALSKPDQAVMIENMVEGLADRLEDEPNDLSGWLRLIRSYTVLAKNEDAMKALRTAEQHFAKTPAALDALSKLARELKLPNVESRN